MPRRLVMIPAANVRQLNPTDPMVPPALKTVPAEQVLMFAYSADKESQGKESTVLAVHLSPFQVELYTSSTGGSSGTPSALSPAVVVGGGGLFHFEHHRRKGENVVVHANAQAEADVHAGKTIVDYGEDGLAIYADGSKQAKRAPAANTGAGGGDSEWVS